MPVAAAPTTVADRLGHLAARGQGHRLVEDNSDDGFRCDPDPLSHVAEQEVG